jgi:hypothetical protein
MNNVIDPQIKSVSLSNLIESSAVAAGAAESLTGALSGYEGQFTSLVADFKSARDSGNTETEVRKALQADQKASGTRHFAGSAGGCSALDLLAQFHGLEGDLPDGAVVWVYRPASNGATGLLSGEASVTALLRSIQNPAKKAEIRDAGHGTEYGKPVVERIIREAASKAEAIVALQEQARLLDKIVREAKASEAGPKSADKYLKAASGPLGKVNEALDAGLVDDVDAVVGLIEALTATLAEAKSHAALAKSE